MNDDDEPSNGSDLWKLARRLEAAAGGNTPSACYRVCAYGIAMAAVRYRIHATMTYAEEWPALERTGFLASWLPYQLVDYLIEQGAAPTETEFVVSTGPEGRLRPTNPTNVKWFAGLYLHALLQEDVAACLEAEFNGNFDQEAIPCCENLTYAESSAVIYAASKGFHMAEGDRLLALRAAAESPMARDLLATDIQRLMLEDVIAQRSEDQADGGVRLPWEKIPKSHARLSLEVENLTRPFGAGAVLNTSRSSVERWLADSGALAAADVESGEHRAKGGQTLALDIKDLLDNLSESIFKQGGTRAEIGLLEFASMVTHRRGRAPSPSQITKEIAAVLQASPDEAHSLRLGVAGVMSDGKIILTPDSSGQTQAQDLTGHVKHQIAIPSDILRAKAREDAREDKRRDRMFENLMQNPFRYLPRPDEGMFSRLKALGNRFPNITEALERVSDHLHLQRHSGGSARFSPLLLVGPPGTGKTEIARQIAEAMGCDFRAVALGTTTAAYELTGANPTWQSARMGQVASSAVMAGSGRGVVILLDELDKVRTGHSHEVEPALLDLLEERTLSRFTDENLSFPMDLLPMVSFIMTANDLDAISGPLRSRCDVVHVPLPTAEQMPAVIQSVWELLRVEDGGFARVFNDLGEDLVREVQSTPPRLVRRALKMAAAMTVRDLAANPGVKLDVKPVFLRKAIEIVSAEDQQRQAPGFVQPTKTMRMR